MRVQILASALGLGTAVLPAGEVRLGLGVFNAAPHGGDVLITYRPSGLHWAFGIRHVQWMDTFHDPFTGRALSTTQESRSGPVVQYLFTPEWKGSWYLAGAVLRFQKRERSLVFGDESPTSATAPALGGGYTRGMGRHFYWNLGMLLSPGVRLKTQTSTGSEEDSGSFDILAQVGVRF